MTQQVRVECGRTVAFEACHASCKRPSCSNDAADDCLSIVLNHARFADEAHPRKCIQKTQSWQAWVSLRPYPGRCQMARLPEVRAQFNVGLFCQPTEVHGSITWRCGQILDGIHIGWLGHGKHICHGRRVRLDRNSLEPTCRKPAQQF